jgi:hypothetical protein
MNREAKCFGVEYDGILGRCCYCVGTGSVRYMIVSIYLVRVYNDAFLCCPFRTTARMASVEKVCYIVKPGGTSEALSCLGEKSVHELHECFHTTCQAD